MAPHPCRAGLESDHERTLVCSFEEFANRGGQFVYEMIFISSLLPSQPSPI